MQTPQGETQVKINKATLWIGGDIYQLRNLARVRSLELVPDKKILLRMGARLILTVAVGAVIVGCSGSAGSSSLPVLVGLIVLVAAALQVYRIAMVARRTTQYALTLETTGNPVAGLVSRDAELIDHLVNLIAHSIDNPPTREVIQSISNTKLVFGDEINMNGNGLQVGKVALGV